MVVTCDIEFDENNKGCYFAGQLISGKIMLKCDKAKEVKAIQLQISGHANVLWSEKTGFKTLQTYEGQEEYFCSNTYLMGSENSIKNTIFVGVQTYTFACQLPPNCPSSFEGQHGYIRYTIKVVLQRPWKYDQSYIKAFTVLRLIDLNFETPQIRIPSVSENYRSFCCGPFTTQPLKMELRIPQAGYVPGQSIPVQALIINNTNISVQEVEFTLVMFVRYISDQSAHHHVQRLNVSKVKSDGVLRNCTRSLKDKIHIPATPPTSLQTCSILQITYQVEMEVKMNCFQKSQLVKIPVIIGNVPLANNTTGLAVIQEQPVNAERYAHVSFRLNQELDSSTAIQTLVLNMPSVSYEEPYHMPRNNIVENDLHAFGSCEFAPLYTVYDIPSPRFEEHKKPLGFLNKSFEN